MSAAHSPKPVGDSFRGQYLLKLFVAGTAPKSVLAIKNIKSFCETHLKDHYALKVVDIYQQPLLAKTEQIVAVPTLIKYEPKPERRFIGSMGNCERLLLHLN